MKKSTIWINQKIHQLNDFITEDLFEDTDDAISMNLFLIVGGFLRVYGEALSGEKQEKLDEKIEDAFDMLEENIDSIPLMVYLLGSKLFNIGLVMNANLNSDFDDIMKDIK